MTKTTVAGVRLDDDLKDEIIRAAESEGRSMSQWIAAACRSTLGLDESAVKCVYVITFDGGHCKVGFTRHLKLRLSSFRAAFGPSVKLIKKWNRPDGDHMDVERIAQEILRPYQTDGFFDQYGKEIFECEPNIAVAAVEEAIKAIRTIPTPRNKNKTKFFYWMKQRKAAA